MDAISMEAGHPSVIPDGRFLLVTLATLPPDQRSYLLRRFYDELILPSFGRFDDELDAFEDWEAQWTNPKSRFHVILCFDKEDRRLQKILGGVAFEYFLQSRTGLISYFVVDPKQRARGICKRLVDVAVAVTEDEGRLHGDGCRAIFAETNSPDKTEDHDEILPSERLKMFQRMGFLQLDCPFVQPPLQAHHTKPCERLLLTVYKSPHLPVVLRPRDAVKPQFSAVLEPPFTEPERECRVVQPSAVREFLCEYWHSICNGLGYPYQSDPLFRDMIAHLENKKEVLAFDFYESIARQLGQAQFVKRPVAAAAAAASSSSVPVPPPPPNAAAVASTTSTTSTTVAAATTAATTTTIRARL